MTTPKDRILTAGDALHLIHQLSALNRNRLGQLLAQQPELLGEHVVLSKRDLTDLGQKARSVVEGVVALHEKEMRKYRKGGEAKKKQNEDLLKAIRQAVETGTPRNASAILETLRKRDDAEWLVFRKRKGQRTLLSKKTIANLLPKLK
jgi:hypothetical protein